MSTRIDSWLVQHGHFESREKARIALQTGAVTVNGVVITKASFKTSDADPQRKNVEYLAWWTPV